MLEKQNFFFFSGLSLNLNLLNLRPHNFSIFLHKMKFAFDALGSQDSNCKYDYLCHSSETTCIDAFGFGSLFLCR